MDELLFLDTETTGNDVLADRLFQVCYKHKDALKSEYFKPTTPITVKSQSITHVTNKMVEDKPLFEGSKMQSELKDLLKDKILVAHNAIFDLAMLAHEGVVASKFICTLKVARYLDTNCVIPEYGLQYLRYYLELNVIGNAHEAEDDVRVLEALFARLYAKMFESYKDHDKVIEEMMRVSSNPFLMRQFTFGKHKGKRIEDVVVFDKPYLEWLLEQKQMSPTDEEDWIYTLKFHLKLL